MIRSEARPASLPAREARAADEPGRPRALLAAAPALPLFLWVAVFIGIPMGIMVVFSFWKYHQFELIPIWNLDNYRAVFTQSMYVKTLWRTLWVAGVSTVLCVLLAYPFAYFLARHVQRWRGPLIILVMVPFWTSFLVRTYAWMSILGERGVINSLLLGSGLLSEPIQLLYTPTAVVIAAVYLYFPFAVLSIYSALEKLGPSLEEAAMDLGAGPWTTFHRITLPLTSSGIQAAVLFVFVPSLGLFVTPALLGGADGAMIGNLQVTIFKTSLDFGLGSALAFAVLAVALLAMAIIGRSVDLEKVYASGVGQLTARRAAPAEGRFHPLAVYAVLMYLFLFLPIAFLVLFSFARDQGGGFPPSGLTLNWYQELLSDPWMVGSVKNSLLIALATVLGTVALAAPAAYAFVRHRFPGKVLLKQALIMPMIVPTIMLGFGLLLLFNRLGIELSLATIVVGHITYVLPYVFFVIAAQQYGFDHSLEEAANDLGAGPLQAIARVTLPLMAPGLLAAGLFAFTLSLDEFIITFLLTSNTQTLPLFVWGMLRTIVSPTVNAVATLIVAASFTFLAAVVAAQWLGQRRATRAGG